MITPVYAGLLGLLMLVLSSRVVNQRRINQVGFGDGGITELQTAIRVHANFTEYVPLALVLLLLVELSGSATYVIHGLGGGLLLGRLLHAWGLSRSRGTSAGRFAGTLLTWMVIAIASVALLMSGMEPRA